MLHWIPTHFILLSFPFFFFVVHILHPLTFRFLVCLLILQNIKLFSEVSMDDDFEVDEVVENGYQYEIQETVYQGAEAKVTKCLWLGKQCMIKER